MSEKFIRRITKYGLLRRVALPNKPWVLVNFATFLFDTVEQAHAKASELNTMEGTPVYLYKPVEVYLEVKMDGWIQKETP